MTEQKSNPNNNKGKMININRQVAVVHLFSFVGIAVTGLLGIAALIAGDYWLATALFASTSLFVASQIVQIKLQAAVGHVIAVTILLSTVMILMLFLVITGGKDNTGPLWIYVVPPVAMFFGGVFTGLVTVGLYSCLLSIILFYPNDLLLLTSYSFAFKTRLLLSFLTLSFLAAFYEYSRQKSYEKVRQLSTQFEQQARHDPLTALLNRRGMGQFLDHEIIRFHRSRKSLSLILVDMDHFKRVNDNFGHAIGDKVLVKTANLLRECVRGQDVVSRWGGEEFLIMLPETEIGSAMQVAENLRQKIQSTPIKAIDSDVNITASFGVCEINGQTPLNRALNLADKALYLAKENGRNRVECANDLSTDPTSVKS